MKTFLLKTVGIVTLAIVLIVGISLAKTKEDKQSLKPQDQQQQSHQPKAVQNGFPSSKHSPAGQKASAGTGTYRF